MELKPRNHGIVIATDHFTMFEGESSLLSEVLRDPEVRQHVNGLWVPRHVLVDDIRSSEISHISFGVGLTDYKLNSNNSEDTEVTPKFRLIYDTSASNSVEDSIQHIEGIISKYPGPEMIFTLSPNLLGDGIRFLNQYFEGRKNVNFLLTGVYPEHKSDDVFEATNMSEEEYTKHISKLADKFGMAGVVGFGGLARYTRVGQYYLGMGVCAAKAEDYVKEFEVIDREGILKVIEIVKRMTSPENTYEHAQNTEINLGRTLFTDSNGKILLPDAEEFNAEQYKALIPIVKASIFDVANRLATLPEPTPIPNDF